MLSETLFGHLQVAREPTGRQVCRLLQRARFLKKMRRTRDDLQLAPAADIPKS